MSKIEYSKNLQISNNFDKKLTHKNNALVIQIRRYLFSILCH